MARLCRAVKAETMTAPPARFANELPCCDDREAASPRLSLFNKLGTPTEKDSALFCFPQLDTGTSVYRAGRQSYAFGCAPFGLAEGGTPDHRLRQRPGSPSRPGSRLRPQAGLPFGRPSVGSTRAARLASWQDRRPCGAASFRDRPRAPGTRLGLRSQAHCALD